MTQVDPSWEERARQSHEESGDDAQQGDGSGVAAESGRRDATGSRPGSAARRRSGSRPRVEKAPDVVIEEGTSIHQYEIIRELGRGGMGQVFLARDTKLGRRVAVKFLRSSSPRFTERFLVEARTTAQVSHENIVVIHEVNEYEGLPFMVLEFLEGEPLTALLGDRRLPPGRAVELMVPVVRALTRAHEYGIVHRDLKPDNVFVTSEGTIKVLDFGIAKMLAAEVGEAGETRADGAPGEAGGMGQPGAGAELGAVSANMTREGAVVGTMPYMAPEQWGMGRVDNRTDLWAVGLMLYEMVSGQHPLAGQSTTQLALNAGMLDQPMPRVGEEVPDLPSDLERIIDRCLEKRQENRFGSARELLDALEPLLPGRHGRRLAEDESPYPGLTAFQEADANRFFGRSREIGQATARIREQPLTAVVGPSGVGKSSFVRAGIVPALKASGERWEVLILRPGRQPMAALASLLGPLTHSSQADVAAGLGEHDALLTRLSEEPGYLGALLRSRARQKRGRLLLFVDQFEELYTMVADEAQRRAFTACLAGVADDAAAPLRVVISMRSDFLDRVAEDRRFLDELTRGLVFLQPPDRDGLREALTQPVEQVGYGFETPAIVEQMLDALEQTPGALPLLQFAAARLWETRDRGRRMITLASYEAMGGIAGTLASHANEVLASFPSKSQALVRTIFQALVTADGTRAIVDVAELEELSPRPEEVRRVVDHLVRARLLLTQAKGETGGVAAVEIVHESLITSWPVLRRWLDEGQEDTAQLEQLRTAARQWDARGRTVDLLWRGETLEEARLWYRRFTGTLPRRDREFMDASLALANRAARRRRLAVVATIAILALLVVAALAALVWVRGAERRAKDQARIARQEERRARAAEKRIKRQIDLIRAKEREKKAAQKEASQAKAQVATGTKKLRKAEKDLTMSYKQLQAALRKAQLEKRRAVQATHTAQKLLAAERARVKRLLARQRRVATELR